MNNGFFQVSVTVMGGIKSSPLCEVKYNKDAMNKKVGKI